MPWLDITYRRGALSRDVRHAMVARLTEVVMFWEKIPDTPAARRFMKAWVHEVDEDADYVGGRTGHEPPFYYVNFRIPANRLDTLAKAGAIRDITRVILEAEGAEPITDNLHRVWVIISEITTEDWGIGGHRDWLRGYTSALDGAPAAK